jgi:hypothetical protein
MHSLMLLATLLSPVGAWAQGVPNRQIPPSVLTEVQLLDNRFELALAADCDPALCFSKGCTYVDHAVSDQPRSTSLPGLGGEAGPGSVAPQEYLTRARCSFVHEESVSGTDVQALVRRLQSKLSKGWMVVTIDRQALQPIPAELQNAPEPAPEPPPLPAEPVAAAPEEWSLGVAARELWITMLPHLAWMIGVVLVTMAGLTLVWAWRRVGRESLEERALLAQLARGEGEEAEEGAPESNEAVSEDDRAFVARQAAAWAQRLEEAVEQPDPELQALVRELLRTRDLPLLAKAVLQFPDSFLGAFPAGGDIATAKLELADYLKSVDTSSLPSDLDFFRALDRHARSAALISQSDAQLVRSLRDEFGAAGLVSLIGHVPARTGALLFALAPAEEQHEMVRLLSARQKVDLSEQLLYSNRMPRGEMTYLFRVLEAARADEPLPAPLTGEISDRGTEFDAAGALSVLLPSVRPAQRSALFGAALDRFHGSLPAWYRGIFLADMLFVISDEARTDLLLELDAETLAAWLALLDADTRERLVEALPDSLRTSVAAASFPSRARLLALAWRARQELAKGFQRQLERAHIPFERVVHSGATGGP